MRMANSSVVERLEELLGFVVVPGTINLRLPEPVERDPNWRYLAAAEVSPEWEAETGQAGYFVVPVLVVNRFRGVAFQADEPGYPADQIELLGEVHFRTTLGLRDGDPLSFSLLDPSAWLRTPKRS
jgi:CTP-dependent riboflavin kinase